MCQSGPTSNIGTAQNCTRVSNVMLGVIRLDLTRPFTAEGHIWTPPHPVHHGLPIHGPVLPGPLLVGPGDGRGHGTWTVEVQPPPNLGQRCRNYDIGVSLHDISFRE
uniref:AC5 n=1 Tax=Soybean chlorotic blotch virus TaxID=761702 RepID=A0A191KUX8_9GEMI|nr:AC5 [Soybean chlorotic blotch virus]